MIRKKGLDHVTVEDLVEEITLQGRGRHENCGVEYILMHCVWTAEVPQDVKDEILEKIQIYIKKEVDTMAKESEALLKKSETTLKKSETTFY